jgi:hypothetical protein
VSAYSRRRQPCCDGVIAADRRPAVVGPVPCAGGHFGELGNCCRGTTGRRPPRKANAGRQAQARAGWQLRAARRCPGPAFCSRSIRNRRSGQVPRPVTDATSPLSSLPLPHRYHFFGSPDQVPAVARGLLTVQTETDASTRRTKISVAASRPRRTALPQCQRKISRGCASLPTFPCRSGTLIDRMR